MKKIFFLLCLLAAAAQAQDRILTTDSTGNVFVLFVRPDTVAVVYQGKHSAFTTDGLFAKDFSAFDLKLKGFLKFEGIKPNLSDVQASKPIAPVVVIPDKIEQSTQKTKPFRKTYNIPNARYFVESESSQKVPSSASEITGMNGYDFAPIIAENLENIWSFSNWKQEYLSIEGNRSVWKDGTATYYLKPSGYFTDPKNHLMDFDLRFPVFTLPAGKTVVVQATPLRPNNYLQKGVSFEKDKTGKRGFRFVGDEWLYELGCPLAYVTTQEAMDAWCETVDADRLLQNFIEKVYYPNKDFGYVMLNWEAVGNRWNKRKDKLLRCLEFWRDNPHNAKLALWTVSGISIPRPIFQGINYDYTAALQHEGNIESFVQQFGDWVSVDFNYAKYVEIGHIGGYQVYPNEDGIIHHYLSELLLHRKFNPKKEILATIWHDQEPIANFGLDYVKVEYEGGSYLSQVKPRVTPSMAYNWGVWTVAVGDGFDCWSDPNYWSENRADWGELAFDLSMKPLPMRYGERVSRYPAQPMKNIDWLMSGVWCVSANKDIIEAKGEWKFLELPSSSYHNKSLLVAYKSNGKDTLLLALDAFGKIDGETKHKLNVEGKEIEIVTYGRYTSVIRL